MKQNILKLLLLILSINIYGQKKNTDGLIKMNTKFTLKMETKDSINYSFKIVSEENFNKEIEFTDSKKYLDNSIDDTQIQGILTQGKFGENTNSILLIKSGNSNSLSYELKIKSAIKSNLLKTSVTELHKGVPTTELWPYQIEYLEFSNFKIVTPKEQFVFQTKIDSTCIKKLKLNLENGANLLTKHLNLINKGFIENSNVELNSFLNFEKNINSEDVSLGHYYSLGESIYPNKMNFEFGNPISFRRVECPIFDSEVTYFYTKNENAIKVVSYNWITFKSNDDPFGEQTDEKELRKEFENKYQFIKNEVSLILGNPLKKNQEKKSGRIDTKWKSENGINAYLYTFKNSYEVCLYIYKE